MRGRQRHLMNSTKHLGASLHFDARDTTVSENGEIPELQCRAGTGNYAENAANVNNSRPILKKTDMNGVPSVKFDGISDFFGVRNGFSARCVFTVCSLDSMSNHGVIGDFRAGGSGTNQVVGYHQNGGGSYRYVVVGSETWNTSGEYTFADRVFLNNVVSVNGTNAVGINCYDRNTRSAYAYAGSHAVLIGEQAYSFTSLNGRVGTILALPYTPSDSQRRRINNSLAYLYKVKS